MLPTLVSYSSTLPCGNNLARRIKGREPTARAMELGPVVPRTFGFRQANRFPILRTRLRKLFCLCQDLSEREMALHPFRSHLHRRSSFSQRGLQLALGSKNLRPARVTRRRKQPQIEAPLKDQGVAAQVGCRLDMQQ
jgi:hypothetical protein